MDVVENRVRRERFRRVTGERQRCRGPLYCGPCRHVCAILLSYGLLVLSRVRGGSTVWLAGCCGCGGNTDTCLSPLTLLFSCTCITPPSNPIAHAMWWCSSSYLSVMLRRCLCHTSLYTPLPLSRPLSSRYFSPHPLSNQQHPKLSIENQFEKLAREASDDVKAMVPKPALAV